MSNIERVPFHGDMLSAVRDERGIWVPIRPVCDALGIDHSTQVAKLKTKVWACVGLVPTHDASGRKQELFCLHLDSLALWLATIETSRVALDVKPRLERYQCEAAKVLADHFFAPPKPVEPPQVSSARGARIGDTDEGHDEVRRAWQLAAYGSKASMQRVGGMIRKLGQCLSPYRVALCDWPVIRTALHELAMGRPLLPPAAPMKRLAENPRQLKLVQ